MTSGTFHSDGVPTVGERVNESSVNEPQADLLRRAADRVEWVASDAGPGWDVYPEDGVRTATFDWINLMGPAIGAPLAEWLRSAAVDAEQVGADWRALATARAILREPS